MDRFGNGEEFTMERTLKTEKNGLSFRDFDKNLFTGKVVPMPISCRLELSIGLNVFSIFILLLKNHYLLTIWHVIMSKVSASFHHRFIDVLQYR